jgi:hypothetical protein
LVVIEALEFGARYPYVVSPFLRVDQAWGPLRRGFAGVVFVVGKDLIVVE